MGPVLLPYKIEYSTHSQPSSKPAQKTQVTMLPILQPHSGTEPSQQYYPAIASLWYTSIPLRAQTVTSPQNRL